MEFFNWDGFLKRTIWFDLNHFGQIIWLDIVITGWIASSKSSYDNFVCFRNGCHVVSADFFPKHIRYTGRFYLIIVLQINASSGNVKRVSFLSAYTVNMCKSKSNKSITIYLSRHNCMLQAKNPNCKTPLWNSNALLPIIEQYS